MRLLTKVMTSVSVAALAVLVAGGINAEAAASKGPTFTGDKTLTGIEVGNMVSYDAVKAKGNDLTWNAKAKWDTYYTATDVDLSNLKTTKDAYVTIMTADSKGNTSYAVYEIKKDTVKKYKGSITGAGALEIEADGKKLDGAGIGNYEYRTANSNWKGITYDSKKETLDFSIAPYEQQGATLYFRFKGKEIDPEATEKTIKDAPEGTTVSTIATDSFVGKEFKVKVTKMANAPTITIDYKTGVAKLKKGAQYRVGTFDNSEEDWADFDKNYSIDPSEAGTIQMRTAATTKKAASKIAVYNWKAVAAPEVKDIVDSKTGELNADKGNIIENELTYEAAEATVKAKATFTITNATAKEGGKTIVLYKAKNTGTDKNPKYEAADTKAVATLAPGKKVVLKDAKVSDGTLLIAQYAGDKKTDVLPSAFGEDPVTVKYNVKAAEEEE